MEIVVIAVLLLLALSTLRFVGRFFSFIVSSFIKLIVIIVFIAVAIYGLDYYGVTIFNKTESSVHKGESS